LPGAATRGPTVVVEPQRGRLRVLAANASACRAGIETGQSLSAALALSATLQAVERSPSAEQSSLASLAGWATTLSSQVSVEFPESVLIEVAGSLRLFGSLAAIKDRIEVELARRWLTVRLCVAPTATSAVWLARAGGADVLAAHELPDRLRPLPLAVTDWPEAVQALLRDLGVQTIGDCMRLPRDGFARRVGVFYLDELDRALGRRLDLRREHRAPQRWRSKIELADETADGAMLAAAAESLLDGLASELRMRQAQIRTLRLVFEHWRRAPTHELFELLEPTHERDRLLRLIEDRLERTVLPAPVTALRLCSGRFLPLVLKERDLFAGPSIETMTQALLERLRSRFGANAAHGVRAVAEHRPERAWAKSGERHRSRVRAASRHAEAGRPLWLLPHPTPLLSDEARRHYRGTLNLCSEPERIESGWWDGHDVERDYYRAISSQGQRLWVFRDRSSHAWFLHGLFG
jgi:protein ImuB